MSAQRLNPRTVLEIAWGKDQVMLDGNVPLMHPKRCWDCRLSEGRTENVAWRHDVKRRLCDGCYLRAVGALRFAQRYGPSAKSHRARDE